MMNEDRTLLNSYLKTLKLPTMRQEYQTVGRKCSSSNASYELFLQELAGLELQHRMAQAIERRIKQAQFPVVKELSSYRFEDVPNLNKKRIIDLARCEFIESRANIVLTGPPGVGKSHIAIAMGREACRRGYKVRFFSAASLVNLYVEARNEKQVLRLEKSLRQCDMVIVDELGYIPLDRTGAEYLFGFFSLCYERTSIMVTTNLPFTDWPQVFANDERLAGALLDRLTHHVHIVEIIADSFRLKSSMDRNAQREEEQPQ
jgi:DNA replication protein DnaC